MVTLSQMVKAKIGFLSVENLRSSDSQGVLAGIMKSLKNLGLPHHDGIPPIPIGLGGDGCNTNRGVIRAVCKLY